MYNMIIETIICELDIWQCIKRFIGNIRAFPRVCAYKYWLLLWFVAVTASATKALKSIILLSLSLSFFFLLKKKANNSYFCVLLCIFIYLLTKAHSHNTQANFYYCLSYYCCCWHCYCCYCYCFKPIYIAYSIFTYK